MDLKIRKADRSEAEVVAKLGALTFLQAYSGMMNQEDLEDYVGQAFLVGRIQSELADSTSAYFIASMGEQNVGYCRVVLDQGSPAIPSGKNAKLERIYMNTNFQGLGAGRRLFDTAKNWALEQAQTGLWLSVWDQHTRGQEFHAKMGFVATGEEQFQVGRECQRDIVMFQQI